MMINNPFPFRFPSASIKQEFKVTAFNLNKSMNELLGELVVQYLEETKRARI